MARYEDLDEPGPVRAARERIDEALRDYLVAMEQTGMATHWVLTFSRTTTDDDGDIAEAIGSVYSHRMPEWQVLGLYEAASQYGKAQYRALVDGDP